MDTRVGPRAEVLLAGVLLVVPQPVQGQVGGLGRFHLGVPPAK